MDIVKCCCCCFGPKPDSDESNIHPEDNVRPVVTPPPPPVDTNVVEITRPTVSKLLPEEKEIDMGSATPQNAETEVDEMVVASSPSPQPENEVDMTSSTIATGSGNENNHHTSVAEEKKEATLTVVPNEASIGSTISVEWAGPNYPNDHIAIYDSNQRIHYVYTSIGNPVQLLMPTKPGMYDIKYVIGQDNSIVTSTPINVIAVEATISGPSEGSIGSVIKASWTGPNENGDYISINKVGHPERFYYAYTATGNPVNITLPTNPGSYELKYCMGQNNTVLVTSPITVIAVEATLTAASEGRAGSTVDVSWTGPDSTGDYIGISQIDTPKSIHYTYTSNGNPVTVTLPTKPGSYELKYYMGQDDRVIARSPFTVVEVQATLSGPTEGRAGSLIEVPWTGPDNSGDYIGICKVGAKELLHHAYTSSGNPANVTLPTKPGSYELKYYMGQDDSVLVKSPITVVAVQATLSGPTEGRAGSIVEVPWSGPDNSGDYIGISKVGTKESLYHAYTSYGNPASITLPTKPGPYELKYFMGQDDSVLVKSPITVVAVQATLSGPAEGRAGSAIEVPWSGPNNSGDYIGISKVGTKESLHHAYTSYGNPASITLPTKPGPYELKYYMGQDDSVLVKSPITVVAVQATLSGPAEGRAGSTIEVPWSGPDNSGDYIGISKVGTKESLHHAYTSYGNPAYITLPTKPGSYELKYYMGQDDSVLVKTAINVLSVDATLSGSAEGRAGSTIEIPWSGPDNNGDYIGIGKVGVKESLQYAYTTNGNPAYLTLPTKAGPYELRYYMGQDNSVLTKAAITITAATATLSTAANSGKVGSTMEVEWSGPDDNGDYIGICPSGKNETLEYVYTSYGSPAHVTLPTKPGAYEIKYFVGQDSSVLVSVPIMVTDD